MPLRCPQVPFICICCLRRLPVAYQAASQTFFSTFSFHLSYVLDTVLFLLCSIFPLSYLLCAFRAFRRFEPAVYVVAFEHIKNPSFNKDNFAARMRAVVGVDYVGGKS